MTRKSITLTDDLYDYLLSVSLRESDVLRQLREYTAGLEMARMQIAPEQGQLLALLATLLQARSVIEIGTFTGYSGLWLAQALPAAGRLVTCDTNAEYTRIARDYWQQAGVAERIELRLGPALETLATLLDDGEGWRFDLAFIDADKTEYRDYYEAVLKLLRPSGLAVIDNTLWDGRVADATINDRDTRAIRDFNEFIHHDDRVAISQLPVADGITLAVKR